MDDLKDILTVECNDDDEEQNGNAMGPCEKQVLDHTVR
jgi:hypothetical protein